MDASALDFIVKHDRKARAAHGSPSLPLVVGINGPQGAGKTTLTASLVHSLKEHSLTAVAVSIDDFYLPHNQLSCLSPNNPLLQFRGNPGTHDIALAVSVVEALKSHQQHVLIPRYEKSLHNGRGDRLPPDQWTQVTEPVHVILIEGWCLGFTPVLDPQEILTRTSEGRRQLEASLQIDPPIPEYTLPDLLQVQNELTSFDALHSLLDVFIHISTSNLSNVFEWRQEQEDSMRVRLHDAQAGLSSQQLIGFISRFIPQYWIGLPTLRQENIDSKFKYSRPDCFLKLEIDKSRRVVQKGQRKAQSSTYLRLPIANETPSVFRKSMTGMNAYQKHMAFVNAYARHYEGDSSSAKTSAAIPSELDILRKNHKFLRTDEDDAPDSTDTSNPNSNWEQRIAKKYYDKLFKEFAIANLERYKEGRVALRWRSKREVVSGIGQFTCANTKCKHRAPFMPPPIPASYPFPVARPPPSHQNPNAHRNHQPNLRSWEVNFVYKEDGETKNALVKIRLCGECGWMLNYKKELERKEAEIKAARKRERMREREERREQKGKKKRQKAGEDLGDDENDKVALESEDESDRSSDNQSDSNEKADKDAALKTSTLSTSASDIWGAPVVLETEKSKDEEMDEFFDSLFAQ
ncbi:hypothetical protein HDU80_002021 [Chytriomyces hyalinus]|nr:hypothetical protein HDU80_002021 [Chytriomyces hyalinus]